MGLELTSNKLGQKVRESENYGLALRSPGRKGG